MPTGKQQKAIDVISEAEVFRTDKPDRATDAIADAVWEGKGSGAGHLVKLPDIDPIFDEAVRNFKQAENTAGWNALIMGILAINAKKELKHGEFIPWIKAHAPFERRTIWRFTRIAEMFLRKYQISPEEAKASLAQRKLLGPADAQKDPEQTQKLPKPVQLAFEFLSQYSFQELCDRAGAPIVKRGGDHGGGAAYRALAARPQSVKDAEEAASIEDSWELYTSGLRNLVCSRREYVKLSTHSLQVGISNIKDCLVLLMKEVGMRNKG